MLQFPRWRVILVIVCTLFGVIFAAPNLVPANWRSNLPSFLPTINLGLDLRGGSQLLLEVDSRALERQRLDQFADAMRANLREVRPRIAVSGSGVVGDVARARIVNSADAPRALESLRRDLGAPSQATGFGAGKPDVLFSQGAGDYIEARITPDHLRQMQREAVTNSIEVIRRRIDPSGIGETTIVRQGDDRIVVQAPGQSDPEVLRRRIGRTALMTFHLLREDANLQEAAQGRVPAGAIFVPFAPSAGQQGGLVLERRPRLTGRDLTNAQAGFDQMYNRPVVNFEFNGSGARTFCRISTANVDKQFAIVLDDRILTAPVINEPICGGRGQISGSFTPEETQELSLLLRAGALPVPLTVIEQRTIGPELGQDAIAAGMKAGVVATIAVVAFMVLAYGLFGFLACLALAINIAMIIAGMSIWGATLSLPGIAGLILTIGMAVDANVLIYERMREEQANGRSPALAIDAGFSRALVTIIDSHVTQIGVALILFWFGHGPVRGFAWTLSIGVVTSVITATLVTQFFIAIWFRAARPKLLPI